MSDDKCGYDDSIIEESALGLDFKSDGVISDEIDHSDDDKDPEDDPSWSFTGTGTAGDKFETDMDASWITMRMISHFMSVTHPDLEEYLLAQMDEYFACTPDGPGGGESKGGDYSTGQYEIYQKYCSIFEESMSDFSDEHSRAEIVQTLKAANKASESNHETMGTIFLDMLEALSDFKEFHTMYVDKRVEVIDTSASSESKK